MKAYVVAATMIACLLTGCAGLNPNVGERTTDIAWTSGDFERAVSTATMYANRGEPWAQLRLGIFYENGWGVRKDVSQAVDWYEKAAAQKAEGKWAEGIMVGAVGPIGYFNQNSDARIAQRNLASVFLKGEGVEKDLVRAYLNIRTVLDETQGKSIFFCCEFSGGRSFSWEANNELYGRVLSEMSPEQKSEAETKFITLKKK